MADLQREHHRDTLTTHHASGVAVHIGAQTYDAAGLRAQPLTGPFLSTGRDSFSCVDGGELSQMSERSEGERAESPGRDFLRECATVWTAPYEVDVDEELRSYLEGISVKLLQEEEPSENFYHSPLTTNDEALCAHVSHGLTLAQEKRYIDAIDVIETFMKIFEIDEATYLSLTQLLIDWHRELGLYMECKHLAARAVARGVELDVPDPTLLMMRHVHLYWMCVVGLEEVADKNFPQLIRDVEAHYGTHSLPSWLVRINSAMPAKSRGDFHQASAIYAAIVEEILNTSPVNIPMRIIACDNYAESLAQAGQYAQAYTQYRSLLEDLRSASCQNHRAIVKIRESIARTQWFLGEREEAEKEWRALVTYAKNTLGDTHPRSAHMKAMQLSFALEGHRWDEAEQWCVDILTHLPDEWDEHDKRGFTLIRDKIRREHPMTAATN